MLQHKVLKSSMSLMLSGVLFGTVTGATFYGVNTVLTGTDTSIQSSVSSSNYLIQKRHLRHRMFPQLPKIIFHLLSQ